MPGKFKYSYLLIITAYLLLTVGMSFSYGQGRKEKIKGRNHKEKSVSGEERLQAEYLFTEAVKNSIIEDFPRALSYLQRSLEMDPTNAAAHYKMAEILLKTGKLLEAEKSIGIALKLDDTNKYLYMLAADIQTQQGDYPEAAAVFESMLQKTDAGAPLLLELAVLYLQVQDYEKAILTFDKAEKILGINEQIILQKQKLYLEQNNLEKALKEGEKLVKNFPHESAYAIQQAEILLNNQRVPEAQTYLQSYLEKNPSQPRAHFLLAKIFQQQQNMPAAGKHLQEAFKSPELDLNVKKEEVSVLLEHLSNPEVRSTLEKLTQELVEVHPNQADAYISRADYLLAVGQKQEARNTYLRALNLDQSNFSVWQNALSLGLELGRFDSVAKEAEEALVLYPNQAAIYYFSGAANLSRKNYEDAVFALEQGKKLAGSNQEMVSIFNSHLGDAYNGLKNFTKSDAAFEAALKVNPENDYILNNYSYYLSLRKENLSLARQMSEKLVKEHPNNPSYLDTHAWVLYQLKEYKEAKKFLERALEHAGQEDGTIVEHYGDVLYKLNQKEEALQQWKKAKGLPNPSDLLDKKIKDQKLYE